PPRLDPRRRRRDSGTSGRRMSGTRTPGRAGRTWTRCAPSVPRSRGWPGPPGRTPPPRRSCRRPRRPAARRRRARARPRGPSAWILSARAYFPKPRKTIRPETSAMCGLCSYARPAVARIYLSPPHLSGRELDLLRDAIDSNWVAPLGPHVDSFERELAEIAGVQHALALSSGTAALHLALIVLGI